MANPLQKSKDYNDRYVPFVSGGGGLQSGGGSGSGSITVEEEDGSPSVASVTIVRFAEADGFSVSSPGAGIALINFSGGGAVGANPSASITLSAQNGVAATFMRSDAAPALSQAIAPTWTAPHIHNPAARTSGVEPYHRIIAPADTGITADTEGIGIAFGGTSANPPTTVTRTLADGTTVATQREFVFTHPTYAAAGATTITTAATVAITNMPQAGANVSLTNRYALWVQNGSVLINGNNAFDNSSFSVADGTGAFNLFIYNSQPYFRMSAGGSTFFQLTTSGGNTVVYGAGGGGINTEIQAAGVSVIFIDTAGSFSHVPVARTGTKTYYFRTLTPADTTLTASTESIGVQIGGNTSAATVTRQFATGALTTQREYVFVAPTYGFVGASTITNAATVAITGAPAQGTNATITNAYPLWVQSGMARFDGGESGLLVNGTSTQRSITFGYQNFAGNDFAGIWFNVAPGSISFSNFAFMYEPITLNTLLNGQNGVEIRAGGENTPPAIKVSANRIVGINTASLTGAHLYVISTGIGSLPAFRADSVANSTVDLAQFTLNADDTNTVANSITFNCNSNGTAAAGFGQSFTFNLESTTTDDQSAMKQSVLWATATHASRKARAVWEIYDTAAREGFRIEASGSAPMIGFLGANAVVRQTLSAAASDPTTTQTLANDLRTALINLGLAA